MNHRVAPGQVVPLHEEARTALRARVEAGEVHGLIALHDDYPYALGWCGLDRREDLPGHDCSFPLAQDGLRRWSVHCFFIHAQHRGQGLARQLLAAAETYARQQGAQRLEGYPSPDDGQPIFEFAGPLKMYRAQGFKEEEQVNPDYLRYSKDLAP